MGRGGRVLSSGHSDTAGESEIRKSFYLSVLQFPEAIPPFAAAAIATAAFHKT